MQPKNVTSHYDVHLKEILLVNTDYKLHNDISVEFCFTNGKSSTRSFIHEFVLNIYVLRKDIKGQRFFPLIDEIDCLLN